MEISFEKLEIKRSFKIGSADERKVLSDEIFERFHRTVRYPIIRKLINDFGAKWVRQCYLELDKQGNLAWKLLCYKVSHDTNIVWQKP